MPLFPWAGEASMPDELKPEKSIFLTAVTRPPEARGAFLEQVCAGNEELRRRVEELLADHERDGGGLNSSPDAETNNFALPPPPAPAASPPWIKAFAKPRANQGANLNDLPQAPASESLENAGTCIGPYKLLQRIGEGGMGTVWMAEQTEPVKRVVAVKVIKAGLDSSQVLARFEAERQAIALMDHPNIAKMFDAGTTDGQKDEGGRLKDEKLHADSSFLLPPSSFSGRPYFVMELVKGVPITTYCDEQKLNLATSSPAMC
jgi:serine/threonine protein kinase